MKKLLLGAAALLALGSAEVASAQTVVRQGPHQTTVITRQPDGDRVVHKYTYGGRQYDRVRGSRWIAPRGWVNRRYTVGAFVPNYFLGGAYYVDPLRMGLRVRPAGANRHWIRVGDDLYLVNNRGRVIETVPNVFYY
jgi:Ni/Co efflux regulator RcnB